MSGRRPKRQKPSAVHLREWARMRQEADEMGLDPSVLADLEGKYDFLGEDELGFEMPPALPTNFEEHYGNTPLKKFPVGPPPRREDPMVDNPIREKPPAPKKRPRDWDATFRDAYAGYKVAEGTGKYIKNITKGDQRKHLRKKIAAERGYEEGKMSKEEEWDLNDAVIDQDIRNNARYGSEFYHSVAAVPGLGIPAIALGELMQGAGELEVASKRGIRNGDRKYASAMDQIYGIAGIPYQGDKMFPFVGHKGDWQPQGNYNEATPLDMMDPGGVFATSYTFMTDQMDEDWNKLDYVWSKPNTKGMKTEKDLLGWLEKNPILYQRFFEGRGTNEAARAKTEAEKQAAIEKHNARLLKVKERGLIGHMTPLDAERLFEREEALDETMDSFGDELDRSKYYVNGMPPLPGSVMYALGKDESFYGDPLWLSNSSQPNMFPTGSRYSRHILDRGEFGRGMIPDGLSERFSSLYGVNGLNRALMVDPSITRQPVDFLSRTTRVTDMYMPRRFLSNPAALERTTPAKYASNPIPQTFHSNAFLAESDHGGQATITYDVSQNPAIGVVQPTGGSALGIAQERRTQIEDTPYIIPAGNEALTWTAEVGSLIPKDRDAKDDAGLQNEADKDNQVPMPEINAANARNPQAPVIMPKKDPNAATLPKPAGEPISGGMASR